MSGGSFFSRAKAGLMTACLLVGLAGAAIGLQVILDRERPPSARAMELSYLPKGQYLRVAVLGYREVTADLIWIRAVQHLGTRYQTKEGYAWAYHAVDVVTDLDPKFVHVYYSAGTVLGVWAGLVEESIALLTKGMRHNPEDWRLPFVVGYDYFYELCDPAMAGKYFRIASEIPGSPKYLPKLAARMTIEAGDPEAALEFLQRLYVQVQDERLRAALALRMKEAVAERDIRFLEEGVRRYTVRYGQKPGELADLVRGGIIEGLPREPLGGRYKLHPKRGTVTSTGLRERLTVHRQVSCQRPAGKRTS